MPHFDLRVLLQPTCERVEDTSQPFVDVTSQHIGDLPQDVALDTIFRNANASYANINACCTQHLGCLPHCADAAARILKHNYVCGFGSKLRQWACQGAFFDKLPGC